MSGYEIEDVAATPGPAAGDAEPGSRLLAEAAQDRGLQVRRCAADLVICEDGQRRVGFRGLVGSRSGTVAHVLCGNPGWLRAHLARHGLPVPATRLVDPGDPDFAQRAAEELGFPVTVRAVTGATSHRVDDPAAFRHAWQALVETAPGQLVLEPPAGGEPIEVAVVGERAVATAPTGPPAGTAQPLAVRAIAALPGLGYGSVRVRAEPARLVIDTVDPSLHTWAASEAGREIATAILNLEFDQATAVLA